MKLSASSGRASRLCLRGIAWSRGSQDTTTLGPIDLEVQPGRFIALLGPTGSGKTSLVKVMAGLTPPISGELWLDDKRVTAPLTNAGYVPSSPCLLPWRSVLDNVLSQLELRGVDPKPMEGRGKMLLAGMDLSDFEAVRPGEIAERFWPSLSICRALVHDPPILLMDEPFGSLDALSRERAATNLQHLWMGEPRTAVLATRDITEAVLLADRIVVFAPGLGAEARSIEIDLPRPRRFDKTLTPKIVEYGSQIRNILRAAGALP